MNIIQESIVLYFKTYLVSPNLEKSAKLWWVLVNQIPVKLLIYSLHMVHSHLCRHFTVCLIELSIIKVEIKHYSNVKELLVRNERKACMLVEYPIE